MISVLKFLLKFSGLLSIVQLSRFFVLCCYRISDNFLSLSDTQLFVKHFFNFFYFFLSDSFQKLKKNLNPTAFHSGVLYYHVSFCLSTVFSTFSNSILIHGLDQCDLKRRKRDLNPRAGYPTYTLSRGASSAS